MSRHRPRAPVRHSSVRALVGVLERTRADFGARAAAGKLSALAALGRRAVRDPRLLLRLHEVAAFLRAYPDTPAVLGAAEALLETVGGRVRALRGRDRAGALEGSGLAGTTVRCPLSHAAAGWLAHRFPAHAELDWEDPDTARGLERLLPFLSGLAAEEALVEASVPARAWVSALRGRTPESDLRWVLRRLGRGPGTAARRALYDAGELGVRWDLGETRASRTRARVPTARVFFQRTPLVRWRGRSRRRLLDLRVQVHEPSPGAARRLLDTARAAVLVRHREVHAFNFADPRALVLAEVGRGVTIAWFGVRRPHRLPLRAHHGYLVLKNGIPVGYGDASLLFDRVEIAYNIFDTYRHGESAFIFVRLLAFLRQALGVRAALLSPFQIGHDNPEAIQSGAFWFYYKLGFRPRSGALRRLALAERRRIEAATGYRSSPGTLARLAEGGMLLSLDRHAGLASRDFDAGRLGRHAAAARPDPAPGQRASESTAARVARRLGAVGWRRWPRSERAAFEGLAPLLDAIPGLGRWPGAARAALVAVARAKGGPREADYLARLLRHHRLRAALLALGSAARPGRAAGLHSASSSSRRSSSRPK
jgi:hypothetical protein